MTHLASDGVYFKTARSAKYICLLPAMRATVILSCSSNGTFYLTNYPDMALRADLTDNETRFQQSLLTLVVTTNTSKAYNPTLAKSIDLSTITRPNYLSDLMTASVSNNWQLSVNQPDSSQKISWMTGGRNWLGMGTDCSFSATGRATDGVNST